MYLAFFPSPAWAFFDFLPTIGILDVANREVVDREAMDGVRAGAAGAGIVGSDTPTDVLAAKVADVASNARAEVRNPVASCAARPHNPAVGAGAGSGSANVDSIDPVVGVIEVD